MIEEENLVTPLKEYRKIVEIVFLLKVVYIAKREKTNFRSEKAKETFIISSCYNFCVCKKEIIF